MIIKSVRIIKNLHSFNAADTLHQKAVTAFLGENASDLRCFYWYYFILSVEKTKEINSNKVLISYVSDRIKPFLKISQKNYILKLYRQLQFFQVLEILFDLRTPDQSLFELLRNFP